MPNILRAVAKYRLRRMEAALGDVQGLRLMVAAVQYCGAPPPPAGTEAVLERDAAQMKRKIEALRERLGETNG